MGSLSAHGRADVTDPAIKQRMLEAYRKMTPAEKLQRVEARERGGRTG